MGKWECSYTHQLLSASNTEDLSPDPNNIRNIERTSKGLERVWETRLFLNRLGAYLCLPISLYVCLHFLLYLQLYIWNTYKHVACVGLLLRYNYCFHSSEFWSLQTDGLNQKQDHHRWSGFWVGVSMCLKNLFKGEIKACTDFRAARILLNIIV